MQAVILAAGKGTRMRPLTYDIPKPMLPIKGKPVLEYTIDSLPEEIDEVIIVINHLGDQIKNYFGDVWKGRKIKYVLQEELNGTGGAIYSCKHLVGDDFLVINGDDLYRREDFKKMLDNGLSILTYEVDSPKRFGVLKVDENGNLIDIIENKGQLEGIQLINTGTYKLNKKFFDYNLVPISETEFGLPQTMMQMAKDFPVKIVKATEWFPLGFPEDIQKAEEVIDRFI
jgi:UDP-N-acetylglucosamine diphosphorylase / glucose-1-phosphate thymidylyltransferase / UDP-N-acetylgalactosamine diphosphorylase / glucosamine-1-phosphate N-acetyltransferase / galactosamine-1-phosphate N-acetyltransferase